MRRMASRATGPAVLLRRWRPDRNPLRRAADRAEAVVLGMLTVMFLAGAPLAGLAASHWVSAAAARARHAEAGWRRVPAVLTQNAPQPAHARLQASLEPEARARWTAPDGAPRTGVVYAPGGARAGRTVMVWTNASGRPTGAPLQPADVTVRIVLAVFLAAGLVGAFAAGAALAAHWVLDKQRYAAWDAAWSQTGPDWTSHR